jgi:cytochrome P450 family 135
MTSALLQAERRPETSLPPGPGDHPLLQTGQFLFRGEPYLESCRERYGDTFTLRGPAEVRIVVTCDTEIVKQVFTGDPNLLHAGESNGILRPLLGDKSLLLLDGPEHLRHRRLMLPPLHGERMRGYGEAMSEIAHRHIARWPIGRTFSVQRSMQDITLEVIVRTVFGIEEPARVERLARPLRNVLGLADGARGGLRMAAAMLSERVQTSRRGPLRRLWTLMKPVDEVLMAEVRERRADPRAGEREDILSLLLAARDEDGNPLTETEIRDELMTLVVAGHETTATGLAWALERLSRYPQVLDRLYATRGEEREAYVDAIAKETLRLRPVVAGVGRLLQRPMEFGDHRLPAGTVIAPSIMLVHKRPDIYPQPRRFRPERFLERTPGTYEWIPFGGGVRRCIGASFALFEMRAVLEALVERVRLMPTDAQPEQARRRLVTLVPSRGGRIRIAPAPSVR